MVNTTGACITIGWLKCAGAIFAFISGERVTTTLYSWRLPIVWVLLASVMRRFRSSALTSLSLYWRMLRLVIKFFILQILLYSACKYTQ
jgi:hypothetical protein